MFLNILDAVDEKLVTNSGIQKEIIDKARMGDIESFEKLLFIYEKKIFNYIFTIVRQKQDAEDLTQETFIKVYKNLKSLNPDLSFKAWLYKIATNATIDWFRKNGKKSELLLLDDQESKFETIDKNFSYIRIETAKDISDALNTIKPEYRTVLLLFYWQGFSYEEIASMLSLPLNTVKTYLRRAKDSVKEVLSGATK